MAALADHLVLSLLWLVGCLPLVTAPAATAALFEVTRQRRRGDEPAPARAYLGAIRLHLRGTLALGLAWMALGAVLLADLAITARMDGAAADWLRVGIIVLLILYALVSASLFPTIVCFDTRPRDQLRTAALVALVSPGRGLLALAAVAATSLAVWTVPLALLIAPSLTAVALLRIYQGALERLAAGAMGRPGAGAAPLLLPATTSPTHT